MLCEPVTMTVSVRRSSIVMSSTTRSRARVDSTAEPDDSANLASFGRHLRAENKAPSTIVTYAKAVTQLDGFPERDSLGASRATTGRGPDPVARSCGPIPWPPIPWPPMHRGTLVAGRGAVQRMAMPPLSVDRAEIGAGAWRIGPVRVPHRP